MYHIAFSQVTVYHAAFSHRYSIAWLWLNACGCALGRSIDAQPLTGYLLRVDVWLQLSNRIAVAGDGALTLGSIVLILACFPALTLCRGCVAFGCRSVHHLATDAAVRDTCRHGVGSTAIRDYERRRCEKRKTTHELIGEDVSTVLSGYLVHTNHLLR